MQIAEYRLTLCEQDTSGVSPMCLFCIHFSSIDKVGIKSTFSTMFFKGLFRDDTNTWHKE